MPAFVYKAKKESAETVIGQVTAKNQQEAIELISQQGLLPVSIDVKEKSWEGSLTTVFRKTSKVDGQEIYYFCRQLVQFLKSGVSLVRALEVIREQTVNPYLKKILNKIYQDIRNGRQFSDCLQDYPQVFSPLFIGLARAGEESGNFREMLTLISEYQRRQDEIASQVRSALTYPVFMAAVGFLTIIFLLVFVFPRMSKIFIGMTSQIPLPTMILLKFSSLLAGYWQWIILFSIPFLGISQWWLKTFPGRFWMCHWQLTLPYWGDFILKVEMARFCRTVELLLKSGLSILRAIRLSLPLFGNEILRKEFSQAHEALITGHSMGNYLKKSKWIPPLVSHLIAVGEESGAITQTMGDIADAFDQDTIQIIKRMTTLLEPVLILTIGLIVGFMVFAILLPVFQMDVLMQ